MEWNPGYIKQCKTKTGVLGILSELINTWNTEIQSGKDQGTQTRTRFQKLQNKSLTRTRSKITKFIYTYTKHNKCG